MRGRVLSQEEYEATSDLRCVLEPARPPPVFFHEPLQAPRLTSFFFARYLPFEHAAPFRVCLFSGSTRLPFRVVCVSYIVSFDDATLQFKREMGDDVLYFDLREVRSPKNTFI